MVIGYCTVTVYFDPLATDIDWLESEVRAVVRDRTHLPPHAGGTIEVPVCYGGDLGPDLADVATFAGTTEDEVVHLHTAAHYRVYVVGFIPGFPYMAAVDPRLALPRRPVPRTHVPAGSVALAAGQTGIYPAETPGGWHIIGRTWVKPYDASRAEPFLFRPGDRVRFYAVSRGRVRSSRMSSLTVVRPGMLTTVQDLGRWGHQDGGVPVAGPMDRVLPSPRQSPGWESGRSARPSR